MEKMYLLQLTFYFIIYSFLGWVLESVAKTITNKKIVNSGFLYGPLCPIYGMGAIIMLLTLNGLKNSVILLFFYRNCYFIYLGIYSGLVFRKNV